MATRIPKSARLSVVLNDGTNLITGAMIRRTQSFPIAFMPDTPANDIEAVANAFAALLPRPVVTINMTEVDQII